VGYGVEFGDDTLVATGLAQTAIHTPTLAELYHHNFSSEQPRGPGDTILESLRKIYDSQILQPVLPYDPNALFSARLRPLREPQRVEEIRKIINSFQIDPQGGEPEFASKVEQAIWASALLMAGTGRKGKKPRLDFFLMHLVTSSIFLKPMIDVITNPVHKANLLRSFLSVIILVVLARGRPRIEPELLMTYTATPRPPASALKASRSAVGSPTNDEDYNPWPAILADVIYHPDPHVIKTIRSLAYAAREYGATPAGEAIGAFISGKEGVESHKGMAVVDGTIFVRAAGMVMDYMGWVANGQEARPDWDRSALGWDDAWADEQEAKLW